MEKKICNEIDQTKRKIQAKPAKYNKIFGSSTRGLVSLKRGRSRGKNTSREIKKEKLTKRPLQ